MKNHCDCEIISNELITRGDSQKIYDMRLYAPGIFKNEKPKPGQFVGLFTGMGEHLLPRPISVCETFEEFETVRLVYRAAGKGTKQIAELGGGGFIKVGGPHGNGFEIDNESGAAHYLVGGGVGVPPLLFAAKNITGKKIAVLGFRDETFLLGDFEKYCDEVHVATEDGSLGFKGNCVSVLEKIFSRRESKIFACGPKPMLKSLCGFAEEKNIPLQVSVEERMACGIGSCLGCAAQVLENEIVNYKRVCKDGPVFDGRRVIL